MAKKICDLCHPDTESFSTFLVQDCSGVLRELGVCSDCYDAAANLLDFLDIEWTIEEK